LLSPTPPFLSKVFKQALRAVSGNNEKKESGIFNRSLALEHAAKNIENFPLAFLHPLCYK
ncbi:hypothetical protein, partial [uncultured Oscillibacter sp.]|uniref:hypothetical protein n=1 Tax=uncultured Oscillibacter sp. TaxID=876091 RepID=UPI00266EBA1C